MPIQNAMPNQALVYGEIHNSLDENIVSRILAHITRANIFKFCLLCNDGGEVLVACSRAGCPRVLCTKCLGLTSDDPKIKEEIETKTKKLIENPDNFFICASCFLYEQGMRKGEPPLAYHVRFEAPHA
jgi:hypothetical protein